MERYIGEDGGKYIVSEVKKRPVVIELTQADYDVLSEEEKNNGTVYFITDGNSPSNQVTQQQIQDAVETLIKAGVVDLRAYFKNDLATEEEGFALDARQGKILNDKIESIDTTPPIQNNLTTTEEGYVLDARQGKVLDEKIAALEGNNEVASINGVELSGNKTSRELGIYSYEGTAAQYGMPFEKISSPGSGFSIPSNYNDYGKFDDYFELITNVSTSLGADTFRCGQIGQVVITVRCIKNMSSTDWQNASAGLIVTNASSVSGTKTKFARIYLLKTNYTYAIFGIGIAYRNSIISTPMRSPSYTTSEKAALAEKEFRVYPAASTSDISGVICVYIPVDELDFVKGEVLTFVFNGYCSSGRAWGSYRS